MKIPPIVVVSLLAVGQASMYGQAIGALGASKSSSFTNSSKLASPSVISNYGKMPLSFEANQGQTDPQVRFVAHGDGYSLFPTDSAAVLALIKPELVSRKAGISTRVSAKQALPDGTPHRITKTDVIRMEVAGASRGGRVAGAGELPGKANYFLGRDSAKWHTNVPTYAKVKYSGVYPGVDLVYYGNQRQLEYDFVVAAGADPRPVRLRFAGASRLSLNPGAT